MATIQKLMTAEELLRLPDDGRRHELVAGELRTMPLHGMEHGAVAASVAADLWQHVCAQRLGRVVAATGFLLTTSPDTVRAPDVAFVSRGRVHATGEVTGYWLGAPDLVVEVISPNDLYTEVEEKVSTWLAHGTRMVIVLNPRRRTVAVHRSPAEVRILTEAELLDGEDVVPGWRVPVRELFAVDD
jgi:Uma2 family endonuclease